MRRSLVTLVAVTALAAWAGAQGPAPALPAADHLKLLRANRTLIDNLVDHGVQLAATDDPVQRADECRKTAQSLASALRRAADDQDPDRVAELAGLMAEVVRDGLTPTLDEARGVIPRGDPREKDLLRVATQATAGLDAVPAAIPAGKVADSPKVRDALAALAALRANLGK